MLLPTRHVIDESKKYQMDKYNAIGVKWNTFCLLINITIITVIDYRKQTHVKP